MLLAREQMPPREPWRQLLRDAIRDPRVLLQRLGLDTHPLLATVDAQAPFAVRVPEPYLACMRPGDPDDPLLKQVLATTAEHESAAGFSTDPLHEQVSNPIPGLLHKYRGRALLIATGGCAVHCRYCFRRHFPYEDNNPGRAGLQQALDYLHEQPDITEIILSGGDPLMLDDAYLAELIQRLEAVPHLQRLRIHTRFPVVIPERMTATLTDVLSQTRLHSVMVLHINHGNELSTALIDAVQALAWQRIPVFNQAVLLRGVNDSVAALSELNARCFDNGIQPYYLHLLDRVSGTAHFEVPESEAIRLYSELAAQQPGYLVPRLVREAAGAPGKQAVAPQW